ncbi:MULTISPECIES: hypothetical protein [unclassified Pseudomonas]|uniref:hypothetical protein n=1 Tax=unclassified Pseudomonas TaxID=196821 RepID=UPI0011AF0907|nr:MULTISPECIES: hypothetical protein [unclassified Pseudomonas]
MNSAKNSGFVRHMRNAGAQPLATLDAMTIKDELLAVPKDNTVLVKYLREEASRLIITIENPWQMPGHPTFHDTLTILHVQTGTEITTAEFFRGDEGKFPFDCEVPKELIAKWGEGINTFTYEVAHYHGEHSDSLDLELIFDRVPPYNQTAPTKIPAIPAVTDANKGGVKLELPEYVDYQPGDRVAYWWEASIPEDPWGVDPVGIVEVGALPAQLPVSADVIERVGDGGVMAVYVLLDKAGNNSHLSDITHIGVALGALPANLKDPIVPQAADGGIYQQDAFDGVIVQVPKFDNWKPTDQVRVIWGEQAPSEWRPVTDSPVFPLAFSIHADTLLADYGADGTGDKSTSVAYEVRRGTVLQGSKNIVVNVNLEQIGPGNPKWPDPLNPGLEKVTINGESGGENHLVDPGDYEQPATLTLLVNAALKQGDVLTFYWGDAYIEGIDHEVQDGEPGTEITKTVPWDVIKARGDDTVLVYYRVQRPGNPNPIRSEETHVLVEAVGIHPVAPDFLGLSELGWLDCRSIYVGEDDVEPAVRVKVPDLAEHGLKDEDHVFMQWSAVHDYTGEDPVAGAALDEELTWGQIKAQGYIWKVPFETYVKQIYDPENNRPDGRARANYSFVLNEKTYESPVQETIATMHNGLTTCDLRPKP